MTTGVHFAGEFLDVYPYMNWIFLLNQEGDLLFSRTDELISDNQALHDALFRQAKTAAVPRAERDYGLIEISTKHFRRLTRLADKSKFCDLRFFYSNIFCGSEDGLQFLSFDALGEQVVEERKLTDAPIASLAAKFMTVFAASLEQPVTTLFDVSSGRYSRIALTGSTATRVGISDTTVNYYFGSKDLSLSDYSRSKVERNAENAAESDLEKIDAINDSRDYGGSVDDVDFIFNSNQGIFLLKGQRLEYHKNSGTVYTFELGFNGRLIRAHNLVGLRCYEFLEGLYVGEKRGVRRLLEGECISTRGYANSVNFRNSVSAVNESGAYIFRLD